MLRRLVLMKNSAASICHIENSNRKHHIVLRDNRVIALTRSAMSALEFAVGAGCNRDALVEMDMEEGVGAEMLRDPNLSLPFASGC